jgi:sensor domain CHASE-containing protein
MKIRSKVMILLTLLFVVLCGVAILFQEMIVMPSFQKLEQRNAQIAMNRVRTSVEHDQETFAVQIMDWANWSELHEFVRGNFSDFGLRNVTSAAMGVIQADAIWIANLDGDLHSTASCPTPMRCAATCHGAATLARCMPPPDS